MMGAVVAMPVLLEHFKELPVKYSVPIVYPDNTNQMLAKVLATIAQLENGRTTRNRHPVPIVQLGNMQMLRVQPKKVTAQCVLLGTILVQAKLYALNASPVSTKTKPNNWIVNSVVQENIKTKLHKHHAKIAALAATNQLLARTPVPHVQLGNIPLFPVKLVKILVRIVRLVHTVMQDGMCAIPVLLEPLNQMVANLLVLTVLLVNIKVHLARLPA
jgi:hypothetical protein